MSRRKLRKPRRMRPNRAGRVFLAIDGGVLDGATLEVPGFTADEYRQVCVLARAGRVDDPLVTRFIDAFCAAFDMAVPEESKSVADRAAFARWLEMVPGDEWTGLDELEVGLMVGGAR